MLANVYDVRVPIAEQYELYRTLRDNGVTVDGSRRPPYSRDPYRP